MVLMAWGSQPRHCPLPGFILGQSQASPLTIPLFVGHLGAQDVKPAKTPAPRERSLWQAIISNLKGLGLWVETMLSPDPTREATVCGTLPVTTHLPCSCSFKLSPVGSTPCLYFPSLSCPASSNLILSSQHSINISL
jgi:hypothetical protein